MSRTLLIDHWNPIALTLTEDKGDGKIRARGIFASVGKPTKNGRRYGKALWEKEIARLTPAIKAGGVVMELDHPEDGKTKLVRAAAKLTDLKIEGEDVLGELVVLSTSRGKELGALIGDEVQVGVSSRGFGTTKARNDGTEDVSEDYKLVTFDAVADPAAPSAYPTFYTEDVDYLDAEGAGLNEGDADPLDEAVHPLESELIALVNSKKYGTAIDRLTKYGQKEKINRGNAGVALTALGNIIDDAAYGQVTDAAAIAAIKRFVGLYIQPSPASMRVNPFRSLRKYRREGLGGDTDDDTDELDESLSTPKERGIAKKLYKKGYRYQVMFKGMEAAPLYAKSPDQVARLIRTYKGEIPKVASVDADGTITPHKGRIPESESVEDELRTRLAEELLDSIREFRERAYADALEAVGGGGPVNEDADHYSETITELRAQVRTLKQENEALRDEIENQGKVTEDADGDESVASALHLAALRIHLEERLHRVKNHEAAREFVGDLMQYEDFIALDSRLDRFTDTIGLTEYGEDTEEDVAALRAESERLQAELDEAKEEMGELLDTVEREDEVARIETAKAFAEYKSAALASLSESAPPLIRRRIRKAATTDQVDRAVAMVEDGQRPSIGRDLMERVRAKARRSLPRGENNPEHEAGLQGMFDADTSTGKLIDSVEQITEVGGMRIDEIVEMAGATRDRRI